MPGSVQRQVWVLKRIQRAYCICAGERCGSLDQVITVEQKRAVGNEFHHRVDHGNFADGLEAGDEKMQRVKKHPRSLSNRVDHVAELWRADYFHFGVYQ